MQSFNLSDIQYWIKAEPEFGAQGRRYLDDRYEANDEDEGAIDPMDPATFKPTMAELHAMGVRYIAPPTWMLVTLDGGKIVPSALCGRGQGRRPEPHHLDAGTLWSRHRRLERRVRSSHSIKDAASRRGRGPLMRKSMLRFGAVQDDRACRNT